jgi:hypothetical protein
MILVSTDLRLEFMIKRKGRSLASVHFTVAVVFFIAIISIGLAAAKILDPDGNGPDKDLLKVLAAPLNKMGIDTILGKADDLKPDDRARVASLAGFTPGRRTWDSYVKETWAKAFEEGVLGIIIAVKTQRPNKLDIKKRECEAEKVKTDPCEFIRRWHSTPQEKRIFVAFTKSDYRIADNAKLALEKAGYTVFIYLKGVSEEPWLDPGLVGELFAQSQHRLVIDSKNSRGSEGVSFEKWLCVPKTLSELMT